MNGTPFSEDAPANATPEETMSALFAGMVIQQTNLALMLLGKIPHPETGKTLQDIESAKMFIDQLEMIEVKTRGNLDRQEEKLLKQSLTALRLAFVEAVNSPATPPPSGDAKPAATEDPSASAADAESKKKFSKKY